MHFYKINFKIKLNYRIKLIFSIVIIWIIVSMFSDPLIFPKLIPVLIEIIYYFIKSNNLMSLIFTSIRVLAALIISIFIGVSGGLTLGYKKKIDIYAKPVLDFLRSIPGILWFPLFIIIFGVNEVSKILVAIIVAAPIILVYTRDATVNSLKRRSDLIKMHKLRPQHILLNIVLPDSLSSIFTGLKISASLSIILIIVSEMVVGTELGIGDIIVNAQYHFNTAKLYAGIIILGMFGLLLNRLFEKLSKTFLWGEKNEE